MAHTTSPQPEDGFLCPVCPDGLLRVVSTKHVLPGVTRRYRRCNKCGHKVKTEERALSKAAAKRLLSTA